MDAGLIAHAVRVIQDAVRSPAAVDNQAGPVTAIILVDPMPLWLFPALFLAGTLLQAAGLLLNRRLVLISGAALVLAAAALDRDLTLAVGRFWRLPGCHTVAGGQPEPHPPLLKRKNPGKCRGFCVLKGSAYLKAFSKLGTTCFLRLMTPGSHTELPSAFTPKAFSTTAGSSETISISEPSFMMSVSSRNTL